MSLPLSPPLRFFFEFFFSLLLSDYFSFAFFLFFAYCWCHWFSLFIFILIFFAFFCCALMIDYYARRCWCWWFSPLIFSFWLFRCHCRHYADYWFFFRHAFRCFFRRFRLFFPLDYAGFLLSICHCLFFMPLFDDFHALMMLMLFFDFLFAFAMLPHYSFTLSLSITFTLMPDYFHCFRLFSPPLIFSRCAAADSRCFDVYFSDSRFSLMPRSAVDAAIAAASCISPLLSPPFTLIFSMLSIIAIIFFAFSFLFFFHYFAYCWCCCATPCRAMPMMSCFDDRLPCHCHVVAALSPPWLSYAIAIFWFSRFLLFISFDIYIDWYFFLLSSSFDYAFADSHWLDYIITLFRLLIFHYLFSFLARLMLMLLIAD